MNAKPTAPKKAGEERGKLPIVGIVLGVIAVALVVAVMFAGSEPLGGAEFGEPTVEGTALPPNIGSNPADPADDPAFGLVIPEVTGQDFAGEEVSIANNGTPKALLFVSHSCPHCQDEIPEIQSWLDATGGVPGVEIITVSTAAKSAAANWPPSEWLDREGWEPPVIADDTDSSVFRAFGGSAIPYWVFVNADGTVAHRNVGRMEINAATAVMQSLIP
ncbi:MAG: TlpA family protein disulfide reductase [bacterium]|nr:TlpA family protein disulfide reductase [bacterium]